MFAWILNTMPVIAGSLDCMVRVAAFCARGGGAKFTNASRIWRTPKFFNAEPK